MYTFYIKISTNFKIKGKDEKRHQCPKYQTLKFLLVLSVQFLLFIKQLAFLLVSKACINKLYIFR